MAFTKADLALSTMWNYRKARCGRELLEQLLALGFQQVELNYQVQPEWLPEIEQIVHAGVMQVSSIHNVFPKTFDERFGTDSVMLGYEDESLRRQAIELAKISIDWACRLGAAAVVFHPTEVPLAPEAFDVPLKKLIAAHRTDSEEFRALRRELLAARQSSPYLARTMKSIEALTEHVARHALPVKLGMENRAMAHQIPLYPEMIMIAERFDGSPTGLWLDTGHGIMMQEMGLQSLPLSPIAERNIIGMHIHDAADGLDHYAPCTLPGNPLTPFRKYILQSPIKVLELSGRLSAQEILAGSSAFITAYGQSDAPTE